MVETVTTTNHRNNRPILGQSGDQENIRIRLRRAIRLRARLTEAEDPVDMPGVVIIGRRENGTVKTAQSQKDTAETAPDRK